MMIDGISWEVAISSKDVNKVVSVIEKRSKNIIGSVVLSLVVSELGILVLKRRLPDIVDLDDEVVRLRSEAAEVAKSMFAKFELKLSATVK